MGVHMLQLLFMYLQMVMVYLLILPVILIFMLVLLYCVMGKMYQKRKTEIQIKVGHLDLILMV
ncbi:hypothetical protein D3C87_1629670 [compost metagenome]